MTPGSLVTCVFLLQFVGQVNGLPATYEKFVEVQCQVKEVVSDPTAPGYGDAIILVDCSDSMKKKRLSDHPPYNDPFRTAIWQKDCF